MVVLPAGTVSEALSPCSAASFLSQGVRCAAALNLAPCKIDADEAFCGHGHFVPAITAKSFRIDHLVFIPPDAQETAMIRWWAIIERHSGLNGLRQLQQAALRGRQAARSSDCCRQGGLAGAGVQQQNQSGPAYQRGMLFL